MTRLLGLLLLLALPAPAGAAKLVPLLIGTAPPADAGRLDRAHLLGPKSKRLFVAIDTPYEIWSGQGSYVHVAVYRPDFTPASGVTVYLGEHPVGLTDDQGTVVVRNIPRGEEGAEGPTLVQAAIDNADEKAYGAVEFESYSRTPSFETAQLYVYTDRGVYNPGQPILIRALAWQLKGEYRPLASKPIELLLLDASGRIVAGARPTTDAFGAASVRIPLAEGTPTGSYTLAAQFEQGRAEAHLQIEHVPPPAIQITHTLRRYFTPTEKQLAFEATLKGIAGGLLQKGTLAVTIQLGEEKLYQQTIPLDGRPGYRVAVAGGDLEAIRSKLREGARFQVVLTATDGSGRSDTLRRDVAYLTNPYSAVLESDKGEYTQGEQVQVQVKLVDVEGVPVRDRRVRLEVQGAKGVKPVTTDSNGVALFRLYAGKEESIEVQAFLDDVAQAVGSLSVSVMPRKPMTSKVEQPVVHERREVPIEVALDPAYDPTEKYVHGDVVDTSGALVNGFLLPIEISGGRVVAKGHFTAPTWGTMLLTLFCAARVHTATDANRTTVGLLTEGQQITVHPDRALTVTLSGIPKQARPGEELTIRARVTDALGRPAKAELGASVVDGAILSLLDPLETRPADRFYDPELKVLSTTGSKILTWPVVSRNWGINRRDIALPPFGFDEPDPVVAQSRAKRKGKMPKDDTGDADGIGDDYDSGGLGLHGTGTGGGAVGYGSGSSSMSAQGMAAPAAISIAGKSMAPGEPERDEKQASGRPLAPPAQPALVVIRTQFPETSLWLPELMAPKGDAILHVHLPDAITNQAITVLASDQNGGVGLVRHDLPVRQDLYARSDLPASLIEGDRVQVRAAVQNLSDHSESVSLSLASEDLEVEESSRAPQTLTVAAHDAVGAAFWVRARRPGSAHYRVIAEAGPLHDEEQRTVSVLPRGPFASREQQAEVSKDAAFEAVIERPAGSWVEASLGLAFPGAGGVLAAFKQQELSPWLLAEEPGTEAVMARQVERVLERSGQLSSERRTLLDDAMRSDEVLLSSRQLSDGAFADRRTARPSAYLTAKALAGFTAIREAGLPVDPNRLTLAARSLVEAVTSENLFPVDDLAFWEGDQRARSEALSAEVFRALCESGPTAVPPEPRGKLEGLASAVRARVLASDDPLTAGQGTLGLLACGWVGGQGFGAADAASVAERLLRLRRTSHWEPSWFHAYGGTLEATAAAVELLATDPVKHAAELRESALFLLGTQSGFGSWRNGSGTAAALRALAAMPDASNEVRSTVTVELNGAAMAKVEIDPRDPFASALALTHLELTPHLVDGKNTVRVRYDGALRVPLRLEERRRVEGATASTHFRAERKLSRERVSVGEDLEVELRISASSVEGPLVVEESLPSNVALDARSLEELRKSGVISEYGVGDGLRLYLKALGREGLVLRYRVSGERPGTSEWRASAPPCAGTGAVRGRGRPDPD